MPNHEHKREGDVSASDPSASKIARWRNWLKERWEFIAMLFAIIAGSYYVLGPRVDEAARKEALSPEVLEAISSRLRPYAVIDAQLNSSSSTFEYDDGGAFSDVVDSVDFRQGDAKYIGILTFKMKRFVRLPLVHPLTPRVYVQSFWRTNKFDWAYEIRTSPTTEKIPNVGVVSQTISDDLSDTKEFRFFVELLTK